MFVAVDKKHKLFRRCAKLAPLPAAVVDLHGPLSGYRPAERKRDTPTIGVVADRLLLARFVPPSVLVNEYGQILYIHGRTGDFLEPAPGEPSDNVFEMARQGLKGELPAAVRQAADGVAPVVRHGLQVKTNGSFTSVTLRVQPLQEPALVRGMLLVSFESESESAATSTPEERRSDTASKDLGAESARIATLDRELAEARRNLQGAVEELATSSEELKSSNEELQSINEELQSTNEELETSREELESLNEELLTVNAELAERNRALAQANDDMQNLLNSTDVAIVFLDDALVIKRFTSQARRFFHVIDSDVGRPISDLAPRLKYQGLVDDARQVLRTLVPISREVEAATGEWCSMRVMPYRTPENVIDGLVLTFVDIDEVKRRELAAVDAHRRVRLALDAAPQSMLVLDEELRVVDANVALVSLIRSEDRHVDGARPDRSRRTACSTCRSWSSRLAPSSPAAANPWSSTS